MNRRITRLLLVTGLIIGTSGILPLELESAAAADGAGEMDYSIIALQKAARAKAAKVRGNKAENGAGTASAMASYRIDPNQSSFIVRAYRGGLLFFMGHDHHVAVRDFNGIASATPGNLEPASLELNVKAGSLEETGKQFTEEQKKQINSAMREQVLEAEKYPEMSFKSSTVSAKRTANNEYDAKLKGEFTLHGVTRSVVIPAHVVLSDRILHATGEFSVNRSDFGVKTKSVRHGLVRVRNKVTFVFDIVAVAS
jgi:polyisoprenoid-binding protein YceI